MLFLKSLQANDRIHLLRIPDQRPDFLCLPVAFAELLRAGNLLYGWIENVSYFIQLFKKYQGMTPKEYARAFAYANTTEIPSLANINKNPD